MLTWPRTSALEGRYAIDGFVSLQPVLDIDFTCIPQTAPICVTITVLL
jgi:hypothetical protein